MIRRKWTSFLATVDDYPQDKFQGRGIVTATRRSVFSRLLANLRLLRWLNCTLPIEVVAFPNELDASHLNDLARIEDVSVQVLASRQVLHDRSTSRYAIKLHGMLQSRFEHILWLDADNVVVRDPEYLFDLPHYTSTGALFWPDFWTSYGDNPIWQVLNVSCRAEDYEQEAGQILINKKIGWKALQLAAHLNGDADVMRLLLGDKDTYRLSWKVLNVPFYFIRRYVQIAGFYHRDVQRRDQREFCGHTMVQHDPFGEILFLHANMIKYHPDIQYSPEPKYPDLANVSNPWRVLRRYANTISYLKASIFHRYGYSCTTFTTDGPPIHEEAFHSLISPKVTMMYLSFLTEKIRLTNSSDYASIVD